jgi:hypothetical protein
LAVGAAERPSKLKFVDQAVTSRLSSSPQLVEQKHAAVGRCSGMSPEDSTAGLGQRSAISPDDVRATPIGWSQRPAFDALLTS